MPVDRSDPWRVGNLKTLSYCTLCVIVIGFAMLLAGAILSGIAFTEVRPNVADENYDRYIKANPNRVVGPIMLAFGLLNIVGGCAFLGFALISSSKNPGSTANSRKKFSVRSSLENIPDVASEKKMLSQV